MSDLDKRCRYHYLAGKIQGYSQVIKDINALNEVIKLLSMEQKKILDETGLSACEMERCEGCPDCTLPVNGGVDLYD